jgi:hypothetical protein
MEGRRLGVLGSLILAETFYRALGDGADASAQRADGACGFDELARVVLGRPEIAPVIEACVPDIATMAALIDCVAPSAPQADLAKSPRSSERDWSEDGRDRKELVRSGAR